MIPYAPKKKRKVKVTFGAPHERRRQPKDQESVVNSILTYKHGQIVNPTYDPTTMSTNEDLGRGPMKSIIRNPLDKAEKKSRSKVLNTEEGPVIVARIPRTILGLHNSGQERIDNRPPPA